jgi:hypothetical protein
VTCLADIFRLHAVDLLHDLRPSLLPGQLKAVHNIVDCRTPALGGQTWQCEKCGDLHYSYHSCRNRHCPKCQNDRADDWLANQQSLLLPAPYFLITVTAPKQLRPLFYRHQRRMYHILFQAAANAPLILAKEKKHLGATIGMLGVLHTWKRDLGYHPHIHFLIPGGGLAPDGCWKHAKPDFFLPLKPLSLLFRRLFRDALKQTDLFDRAPKNVWRADWVCHIKPVGDGRAALKYLAPYIMRVALSDKNILGLKNGVVTWRYRDAKTGTYKIRSLSAVDFIRRFLRHVLPKGFVKVRYFGFLATKKREHLNLIKELIGERLRTNVEKKAPKQRVMRCRSCGGELICIAELPRRRGPPELQATIALPLFV